MKALFFKAINEKCLEDCPKPTIELPTDAIVKSLKLPGVALICILLKVMLPPANLAPF